MGYIFVIVIGAIVVAGLVVAFISGAKRPAGKTMSGVDITVQKPAADEPTPGDSSIAGQRAMDSAQKHIPPA